MGADILRKTEYLEKSYGLVTRWVPFWLCDLRGISWPLWAFVLPPYRGDSPDLFPVDGIIQWVLGEAAARGSPSLE